MFTYEMALKVELTLYASCNCSKGPNSHKHTALLQRVFLTTPTNPCLPIQINPLVQIILPQQRLQYKLHEAVTLPVDTFVCLRLPYVYEYNGKPVLQSHQSTFQLVSS